MAEKCEKIKMTQKSYHGTTLEREMKTRNQQQRKASPESRSNSSSGSDSSSSSDDDEVLHVETKQSDKQIKKPHIVSQFKVKQEAYAAAMNEDDNDYNMDAFRRESAASHTAAADDSPSEYTASAAAAVGGGGSAGEEPCCSYFYELLSSEYGCNGSKKDLIYCYDETHLISLHHNRIHIFSSIL